MSNRLSEVFPKSLGNNMDLDQTSLSSHTGSRSEFRQVTNIPMLSCPVFFLFKKFYTIFKSYLTFTVITKYWLCSPGCAAGLSPPCPSSLCLAPHSPGPPCFPCGSVGKESACRRRRREFDPWIRKIPWRRAWLQTPVFLPGESHGQSSLAGYSPWGRKQTGLSTHNPLPKPSVALPPPLTLPCFLNLDETTGLKDLEFAWKIKQNDVDTAMNTVL